MSLEGSTVEIIYDDAVDVASDAVIVSAEFTVAANANPGTATVVLKDPNRDLSFITGRRLRLRVDGQPLWSGYSLIHGRGSFFPAGDGREDTKARRWVLQGVDNNTLLDRRVLRYPANYLGQLPHITVPTMDGVLLRRVLANYVDMPPEFDISSQIDDVIVPAANDLTSHISVKHPWYFMAQGTPLRATLDDLALWSAAVFYIGPDDVIHYHALQTVECPWGFSDRPNKAPLIGSGGFEGAYYGFRELDSTEDGSAFGTDALVWGGSMFAGSGSTVFHRAIDPALEAIHGKWQRAETHFDETNFKTQPTVTQRANMIVFGNPTGTAGGAEPGSVAGEGPRGMRFPGWSYNFTWFGADVPMLDGVKRHLYPGDLVPIQLWAFSEDGGVTPFTKLLPLRQLSINFPSGAEHGKAHVRFGGTFDLRNEDSKFLWKYLRAREPKVDAIMLPTANDSTTTFIYGSIGTFVPTPPPDGVTTDFSIPVGYIPGTTVFTVDGLEQGLGTSYAETDSDAGTISTLGWVPRVTDRLLVRCRTLTS